MKPPRGLVPIVALTSMLGPFSIDTYLPSFPDIGAEFGVGTAALAQTLSFYLAAFAGSTLVFGPLADRFGRRPVVIAAILIFTAASLGCLFAPDFTTFLAMRTLQGLAASGGIVIGRAVIRDAYPGAAGQKAMSQVMLLFAVAPAIAPIIGGWLHDLAGWRSVFAFLVIYAVAVLAMLLRWLPETLDPAHRQSIHPSAVTRLYAGALAHPRFIALVLALGLFFGGQFVYIAGSPAVIFDHLGLGLHGFPALFVPMVAGMMAGSWVSARLAHRWPAEWTVKVALAVAGTAAFVNLAQAGLTEVTPVLVIAPLVLYTFGMALAMPNFTVMALDCFPRNRGMASAVQGCMQTGMMSLVTGLIVPLVAPGIAWFALAQALLLTAAIAIWLVAQRFAPTAP